MVTIRFFKNGKTKKMKQVYADIFIKGKTAELVIEPNDEQVRFIPSAPQSVENLKQPEIEVVNTETVEIKKASKVAEKTEKKKTTEKELKKPKDKSTVEKL